MILMMSDSLSGWNSVHPRTRRRYLIDRGQLPCRPIITDDLSDRQEVASCELSRYGCARSDCATASASVRVFRMPSSFACLLEGPDSIRLLSGLTPWPDFGLTRTIVLAS